MKGGSRWRGHKLDDIDEADKATSELARHRCGRTPLISHTPTPADWADRLSSYISVSQARSPSVPSPPSPPQQAHRDQSLRRLPPASSPTTTLPFIEARVRQLWDARERENVGTGDVGGSRLRALVFG